MNHTFMRKAVATCAATGAAASFAVLSAPAQAAPPVPSEPLPSPTSFVVLQAGKGTDKATAAVKAAGGTVVQEWPQIGVVIAQASDGGFDDKFVRHDEVFELDGIDPLAAGADDVAGAVAGREGHRHELALVAELGDEDDHGAEHQC